MILSIVNLKGGVGKSTVSQNMAVYFATEGVKVCIVDTDFEQQTSMKWVEQRGERQPRIPVFAISEKALSTNLAELKETYQLIIIDGTPALSTLASRILLESDMVLVPITPTGFDLWSFERFLERYNDIKSRRTDDLPAYIVLNRYRKTSFHKGAEEAVRDFDMEVLQSRLGDRMAYQECGLQGMGVTEGKDKKAAEEVVGLCEEVFSILQKTH
jgi:chromosome partitioning protein